MPSCNFDHYDVTIAGAGPTGTVLAYDLAKAGLKVLIIEKEKLPRDKVCAGGVTVRASSVLPFDFKGLIEDVVYGVRLSYHLKPGRIRTYDKPLAYMVSRDKFDHFLAKQCCQAGATLIDGLAIKYIEAQPEQVIVHTDSITFNTPILVGADGANSVIVRSLGWQNQFEYGLGLNGNIIINQNRAQEWKGLIGLDYGIPGGYAWVFPKSGYLSIGAGGPSQTARKLKPYTKQIAEEYDLGSIGDQCIRGHRMPIRQSNTPLSDRRVLLVGDAAGVIDPLSGEGLYYGFKSAHIASIAIIDFIQGKGDLKAYDEAVIHELGPELKASQTIQNMNRTAPRLFFQLLKENDRVWSAFCRLLRGEKTYGQIRDFLPQPWRGMLFRVF